MSSKPAVLVVDDEPYLLTSLSGLLRRDFELHTAESADAALEIMAEHPIQVLMTDQRMPGMTGSEFLQSVCQHNYPATLILFTGYADIKSVIDAVNTGRLYRYLTKPWDPGHLIELLHEAAAEYDRRVAFQDLSQNLERYVSLGLQITKQLGEIAGQSGGIDQNTLATFTQACRSLAEVSESASELGSGDS